MSATNTRMSPVLRFPRPEVAIAVVAALAMIALAATKASGADLSRGELIVIALRLVVPFLIFRFWLVGGITVMLLDAADVIIIDLLGLGGFGDHYAELDKVLDSYYYVIELVLALRWRELPFDYVAGRHFRLRREFENGPVARVEATVRLDPDGGGTRVVMEILAAPRSGALAWLLPSIFRGRMPPCTWPRSRMAGSTPRSSKARSDMPVMLMPAP